MERELQLQISYVQMFVKGVKSESQGQIQCKPLQGLPRGPELLEQYRLQRACVKVQTESWFPKLHWNSLDFVSGDTWLHSTAVHHRIQTQAPPQMGLVPTQKPGFYS